MAEEKTPITPEGLKKLGFTGPNIADFYNRGNIGVYKDCNIVLVYPKKGKEEAIAKGVDTLEKLKTLCDLINPSLRSAKN